ncbi:MAG: hydroxymethylpyrimidine/phosphomethylpyrimidine kinase [Bacteroidetes bacterium]|nr:hydroxymethylpyrimidine/phosphomethylpyrimidine kinase [Bacteroidota bacterium]
MSTDADRANVLVVAGYDQSAGAGVLSDVKTLEAHGVYGYAVCTGFTFQNERTISRVQWFPDAEVFEQIDLCFASRGFDWVKMGITESMASVARIIGHLRQHNPEIRLVLDPVIKASSGHVFWDGVAGWEAIARQCYLVTPNWEEIGWLYPGEDEMERCRQLTKGMGTSIYLKGGHHPELPGRDYLWTRGELLILDPGELVTGGDMVTGQGPGMGGGPVYPKHGSGCVLSSSLTANLALGYSLPEAAFSSKKYINQFLTSNKSLLG